MRKIPYVLFLAMLLIGSFFIGMNIETAKIIKNNTSFEENDADLPVWNIGDKWTYNLIFELEQHQYFNLDGKIEIDNLILEVLEIQNDNDLYKLKMTVPEGDLSGSGSVDLDVFPISGQFFNGKLDGFVYVKKSTLELHFCQGTIEGDTNKILLPHFKIGFQLEFEKVVGQELLKTNFSALTFPMNIDQIWTSPFTYLNFTTFAYQPNLGPGRLYTNIPEHEKKCVEWDIINVGPKVYDALKISGVDYGERSDICYSPAAGNIVKIDYKNIGLGIGYNLTNLEMILKSTSYEPVSDPPETPSTPTGGTSFVAGETGVYESSTVDPDGNKIRYIFSWDDGTDNTCTDFVDSGEIVEVEHVWGKGGSHDITVKARDIFGKESSWSDSLTIYVTNNPPTTPSNPDGPSGGSVKDTYTYITSSDDQDDHKIRYGWDWNGDDNVDEWTDFYNSGIDVSTSHKWSSKGTYNIKVKAEDQYGEESNWSESIPVVLSKNKAKYSFYTSLIEIFGGKFPIIFFFLKKFID